MWGSSRYDDDMCQLDDDELMAGTSMKLNSTLATNDVNKVTNSHISFFWMRFISVFDANQIFFTVLLEQSFNPMMEPDDDWPCQFDGSTEVGTNATNLFPDQDSEMNPEIPAALGNEDDGFTFPNGVSGMEEEEEVTEVKIRAFLVEKVQFVPNFGLVSVRTGRI